METRIRHGRGFIAALDQSGGSTPKTLVRYGVPANAWSTQEEMFRLVHAMRCRILTAPVFTADRILAAILFEKTMEGMAGGLPIPKLLHEKGIVPFLKIDQGLEEERNGVQCMRPINDLTAKLVRAKELGIFGTKARSVVKQANRAGIAEIVAQQVDLGKHVAACGLMPILEPEYDIQATDRAEGETILREEILAALNELPEDSLVILKLSIPVQPNAYQELVHHSRVARVVALSGGYERKRACEELAKNEGMIASFSRALLEDLRVDMSDEEFNSALREAIEEIYCASVRTAN